MRKLNKTFGKDKNTVEAMYEITRAACSCRTVYCAGQCNRNEIVSQQEWQRLLSDQNRAYTAAGIS